jgi:hypothetical protein
MHYCSHQCVDFIEDDEDCDPYYDYFCKPKWNEPRRRCYEGIPIDKKIPKTHKDEYEFKQYWHEQYKLMMLSTFGAIWCIRHGII